MTEELTTEKLLKLVKKDTKLLKTIAESLEGLTSLVRALQVNKEEKKDIVKEAEKVVSRVMTGHTTSAMTVTIPPVTNVATIIPPRQEQQYPIPPEYREIIDQTLNKHFGIEIKYMSDPPAMMFTISVPKKYSNMSNGDWKTKGVDLRSKVITFAEGSIGVKAWADGVFNNLSMEIRAMVITDRVNAEI